MYLFFWVFYIYLGILQSDAGEIPKRTNTSFIVTLSLIRRTACARAQFSGCSSTTNARSETGQMAVCCQNLTLGVLSSHSALSLLVGVLFKNFGLFLSTYINVYMYVHACYY
jgi:hypothetical protein